MTCTGANCVVHEVHLCTPLELIDVLCGSVYAENTISVTRIYRRIFSSDDRFVCGQPPSHC